VAGDFNAALNPALDRPQGGSSHPEGVILPLLSESGLTVAYRTLHPNTRSFTLVISGNDGTTQTGISRIDGIWVSDLLSSRLLHVENTDASLPLLSDHRPVVVVLDGSGIVVSRKSQWAYYAFPSFVTLA
jgi:exonuclease III